MNSKIEKMTEFFNQSKTLTYEFRMTMLHRLESAIIKYEDRFYEALKKDLNKSSYESYLTEYAPLLSELNYAKANLRKWMKPIKKRVALSQLPGSLKEYHHPFGLVLNVSPWNYPLFLPIRVLIYSIASGNCMVLKLSEKSVHTSQVIMDMISNHFDERYILPFMFGKEESLRLLNDNKFDYIFFTGNKAVGKVYLKAAAEQMIPATLELGGKSPVIVHKDADVATAVKRILFGKFLNAGQVCVAPDYILVHEDIKAELVREFKKQLDSTFSSEREKLEALPMMISQEAFDRQLQYLEGQRILAGGEIYKETRQMGIALIDEPDMDSLVMKEEIFGPVFPVHTYRTFEDIKQFIDEHEKPLALYVFSMDDLFSNRIIRQFNFGGASVNDTIMHMVSPYASFGGVGSSGMGKYVGYAGFKALSNVKTVYKRKDRFDVSVRFHPYLDSRKKPSMKLFR